MRRPRAGYLSVRDVGLLGLRLGIGGGLFAHGAQKLLGWFGGGGPGETGKAFDEMGFVPGNRTALMAGISEAGSGILLALGAATGPAAAAAVGTMTVAGSVHAPQGFFNAEGGFELPATLGVAAASLALTGPGRISVDYLTDEAVNRPWMTLAAFGGALASAVSLIGQRRSRLARSSGT